MLKSKIVILLAFLLISLSTTIAQTAKIDEAAPAFTLKDVNGKSHNLADFKGKHVVLEWINYDCPFVKKHYESGNMQKIQKQYTAKGIVWLAICSSAPGKQGHFDNETIKKRSDEYKSAFTAYLIDEDGKVGKLYGAKTTPHMYIINPKGDLVYVGAIDSISSAKQEDIEKSVNYVSVALDAFLSGSPLKAKVTNPYGCSVKY